MSDVPEKTSPAANALALGSEIKQIVAGTALEKDANLIAAMYSSGFFKDTKSLSQAITKALIGEQMGMGLVQSMNSLYVIDGKVAMDSHSIRNTAVMAGFSITTKELTDKRCVLEWKYQDRVLGESEYTWDEVVAAGWANKDNYRKHPKDMLLARATTRGARMYANQAFGNQAIFDPEELGGKDVIDVSPVDPIMEQIRAAETAAELKAIVSSLEPDDKRRFAEAVSDRFMELGDAA